MGYVKHEYGEGDKNICTCVTFQSEILNKNLVNTLYSGVSLSSSSTLSVHVFLWIFFPSLMLNVQL